MAGVAVGGALAFLIITVMHVVLGELSPKSLAIARTERTVLWGAPPMRAFYLWAGPRRPVQRTGQPRPKTLRDPAGTRGRSHPPIPRTRSAPVKHIRETGLTRLPLCEPSGGLDACVGLRHAKDLLVASQDSPDVQFRELAGPIERIPESMLIDERLERLRRRQHFALVVDEYATAVGIVTLEDVLEEIVGAIKDEFDPDTEDPVGQRDAHARRGLGPGPTGGPPAGGSRSTRRTRRHPSAATCLSGWAGRPRSERPSPPATATSRSRRWARPASKN